MNSTTACVPSSSGANTSTRPSAGGNRPAAAAVDTAASGCGDPGDTPSTLRNPGVRWACLDL